jgi:hypothetical protein
MILKNHVWLETLSNYFIKAFSVFTKISYYLLNCLCLGWSWCCFKISRRSNTSGMRFVNFLNLLASNLAASYLNDFYLFFRLILHAWISWSIVLQSQSQSLVDFFLFCSLCRLSKLGASHLLKRWLRSFLFIRGKCRTLVLTGINLKMFC